MSLDRLVTLTADLVQIDSRSSVSNLAIADRIEAELSGFEIERTDYRDAAGVIKRLLVARRGQGGLAFSAHMDTVPNLGWSRDPWTASVEAGRLYGLGATDMKGPLAACVIAAQNLPRDVPVCLMLTADEETTKLGSKTMAETSRLARDFAPRGIVVAEPTELVPVRGHRSHIDFFVVARGVQAHSSTGQGLNANWALVEFLVDMKAIAARLRIDPALLDAAYDPPFSDFNPIIDNHGTAVNITVPVATVRIKYRFSAGISPSIVIAAVEQAALRHGLEFRLVTSGDPMELAEDHPLIRFGVAVAGQPTRTVPFGTDAAMLQKLAPCLVLGPGTIAEAHKPDESVSIDDLVAGVKLFEAMAKAAVTAFG
jgi:acetylornithine deacetylase/succinyl-diaminopimelate desuccinylase-like protein